MKRCLERLEQPDWTALSPAQLCEIACVGERTLQYAFRERFGLTPAAFLKARRLAVVHQRLLQAELGNDTVGDAAASLGFWHLSHFAADYRHAFGEMPSETLKRSR
jgi:AraC family ethanolamine operon transcriptional activator